MFDRTHTLSERARELAMPALTAGILLLAFRMLSQLDVSPGLATLAAIGTAGESAASRPATISTPVSCEKLPHVPGKSISTVLVHFPPNAYSPAHRHPGSVSAYILKGTIRSQLDGGPVGTFAPGEMFFEPPGTLHNFAENASTTEAAELLATFVADTDCGPLVIPER